MFWEDYYHKHPIDAKRTSDGREVKFVTGDPIIDKWEDEIAKGLIPDLTEGLPELERRKALEAQYAIDVRESVAKEADAAIGDGFTDLYEGV